MAAHERPTGEGKGIEHAEQHEAGTRQGVPSQRRLQDSGADSDVEIAWSEVGGGHWEAVCVCGVEHYFEPVVDRVRFDPLDPKTSRHLGQCEYVAATDPALLRIVLKVKDGANDGYWWVECQGCDTAWQVPYYAESVGGLDR